MSMAIYGRYYSLVLEGSSLVFLIRFGQHACIRPEFATLNPILEKMNLMLS